MNLILFNNKMDFGCWHTIIRTGNGDIIKADFLNKSRDGAAEEVLNLLTNVWKIHTKQMYNMTKDDIEDMVKDAYGHHQSPITFNISCTELDHFTINTMFRYLDE